ncbi:MAG: chloride channel protein [Acidimicrobiales bacterium]
MLAKVRMLVPEAVSSKVLLASAAVGLITGLLVSVFEYLTIEVVLHHVQKLPLAAQALAPVVGLVLAWLLLRTVGQGASNATSEEYVTQFHSRRPTYKLQQVPAKMLAGVATIGSGGALGLEGPSIYMGSAIGHFVYEPLERRLGRGAAQQLLTAGAAAGVAAVFQTPATGVVFALESPYRDDVAHHALLPSLIAAAVSYLTFVAMPFTVTGTAVGYATDHQLGSGELVGAVVLGILAGFGGRTFAWFVRRAKDVSHDHNPLALAVVGGLTLSAVALIAQTLVDEPLTLGPGNAVIQWMITTNTSTRILIAMFFLRAVATLTTVAAGGVGGLFIPLAVQGVLLGKIVGDGLDFVGLGGGRLEDPRLWPVLGLAAFLAAGYRTPIAAVMFVAESSRGSAVVPALIAAAFSQLVAGSSSVSVAQKEERLGGLESRLALPLSAALETDVMTVPPDASVNEFVWVHALGRRQAVVPVVDGNRYLGLCSVDSASDVDRERWDETPVTAIMDGSGPVALPAWALRDAVAAMSRANTDVLPVTDGRGGFVGLVRESEIVKLNDILDETEASESTDPR